jgi:hypothetical protein
VWKSIAYAKVAEDGQLIEFEVLVCRDDGHAVHLAKRRAFSGWNMQKTMTNVEQQDARLIAMDGAVVAAIRLHAPEFEAAYLADDLPRWLQCLLDRYTATAERVADRADDDAFIEILSALLATR